MKKKQWIWLSSCCCCLFAFFALFALSGCGDSKAGSTPQVVTSIQSPSMDLDRIYSVGDYEKAIPLLQQHLKKYGNDGRNWFRLGYALHSLERYEEAIEAYETTASVDSANAPIAFYNWACALALLNRPDEALGRLEMAISGGFNRLATIEEDPDLDSIRGTQRFEDIMQAMSEPERDAALSKHTEFDFCIGDWDLEDRSGKRSIRTSVEQAQNGFVLNETWRGDRTDAGSAMTFFDPATAQWSHTRVSNKGTVERYSGQFEGETLKLKGQIAAEDGSQALRRLSFTPNEDESILLYVVEESTDSGATWKTVFNGRWIRRKPRLNA